MVCGRSVPRRRGRAASGPCSTTATSSATRSSTPRASTTTSKACGTTRRGSRSTCQPTRGSRSTSSTNRRWFREAGVKILLAAGGRLKEPYLVAAAEEYVKRLRPMCTLVVQEVKDDAALLAAIPPNAHLYAFDERGEMVSSAQFAELLAAEQSHGGGAPVAFAIGGADGHSDAVRKRAKKLLAFGKMTIAHRLEQNQKHKQNKRNNKNQHSEPYH